MFAPAFDVFGMEPSDWGRLAALLPVVNPLTTGSTGLIALGRRERLVALWRVNGERIAVPIDAPLTLEQLAETHEASWVMRLHPTALDELFERYGARVESQHGTIDQWLLLATIIAELVSEAAIAIWPRSVASTASLLSPALRSSLNALCPEGKAVLVGVFDDDGLHTCLGLMRGSAGIERVIGPGAVRQRMGLLSGDWRRDYVHLVNAFEVDFGPVAAGCFTTRDTWSELVGSSVPGVWSRAVAARDVVLQPINPVLAIPLGIDVGRAALATVSQLAAKVAEAAPGPDSIAPALERFRQIAKGGQDVSDLLGFDPLQALAALLKDNKRP